MQTKKLIIFSSLILVLTGCSYLKEAKDDAETFINNTEQSYQETVDQINKVKQGVDKTVEAVDKVNQKIDQTTEKFSN